MASKIRVGLAVSGVLAGLAGGVLFGGNARAQQPEIAAITIDSAVPGWTDAGIELSDADRVSIHASGSATWDGGFTRTGPEGVRVDTCPLIVPSMPVGAILVRVNGGAAIMAQNQVINGPGRLQFAFNDCQTQYFDNAGSFNVEMTVERGALAPAPVEVSPEPTVTAEETPVAATVQPEPVITPAVQPAAEEESSSGSGILRWLLIAGGVGLLGAGGWFGFKRAKTLMQPRHTFYDSLRLESSAWLAPMRLRLLQGERFPKRFLTVGGPDADIDFGLDTVRAHLIPTPDGGCWIEQVGGSAHVHVEGAPVVLRQRLGNGQRVRVGHREFVFLDTPETHDGFPPRRTGTALDKPDPRAVA